MRRSAIFHRSVIEKPKLNAKDAAIVHFLC